MSSNPPPPCSHFRPGAVPAAPRPDAGEAPDYKTALKTALAAALTPSAPDAPGTPPDGDTR